MPERSLGGGLVLVRLKGEGVGLPVIVEEDVGVAVYEAGEDEFAP